MRAALAGIEVLEARQQLELFTNGRLEDAFETTDTMLRDVHLLSGPSRFEEVVDPLPLRLVLGLEEQ
jgi:hypothetical protein